MKFRVKYLHLNKGSLTVKLMQYKKKHIAVIIQELVFAKYFTKGGQKQPCPLPGQTSTEG